LDKGISWQAEMGERATQLARKLGVDPQEAKRQLAEWEQETVKNLGLG
jgi:predicted ArsR family transcriptional regulator